MFKNAVQQGRSERVGEGVLWLYVEPLSDARTPLADFFSILLEFQEIAKEIFSNGRQYRFWMELHPLDTERLMTKPHDLAFDGFSGDLTTFRKIVSIHD
jgi:hypothetical protein